MLIIQTLFTNLLKNIKGVEICMFEWSHWTRIDLRKPNTFPPADTPLLLYIEGEGQVVGKIVDKRYWEKTIKPSYYLPQHS